MARFSIWVLAAVFSLFLIGAALAEEIEVDLELVLAVDVSGSMDADEHDLQRAGYVAAIAHPDVVRAIGQGFVGRIAVTYVEWAGDGLQNIVMPWTVISDAASARAFSETLAAKPITDIRRTSISSALQFSLRLFDGNGFAGLRRVIDVSGDGANNSGPPVVPVRDQVVGLGVTINGLPIMLRPSGLGLREAISLDAYYRDCVIGGAGAFTIPVIGPEALADAVRRKLVLEIAGAPAQFVPASMQLAQTETDCLIGERMRRYWDRE